MQVCGLLFSNASLCVALPRKPARGRDSDFAATIGVHWRDGPDRDPTTRRFSSQSFLSPVFNHHHIRLCIYVPTSKSD